MKKDLIKRLIEKYDIQTVRKTFYKENLSKTFYRDNSGKWILKSQEKLKY